MHRALTDFVLELVQNAVDAGAGRVWVSIREGAEAFSAAVRDDGPGMTRAERARAEDPFRSGGRKHPGRRVGLGLPLLRQTVEMTDGRWRLRTAPGRGTRVAFAFDLRHPDTPPVGDVASLLLSVLAMAGGRQVRILRMRNGRGYRIDGPALAGAAGGLDTAGGLALARMFVEAKEEALAESGRKRGHDHG